jgi:hypothetical protein
MGWYLLAETKSSRTTITPSALEGDWAVKKSNRYY